MKNQWAEWIVRAMEIGLLTAASTLLLYDKILALVQKLRMRNRLQGRQRLVQGKMALQAEWEQTVQMAFGEKAKGSVFLLLDCILFVALFVPSLHLFGPLRALFTAILGESIPWLFYVMRLSDARRKGSREGALLISQLLRRYRLDNKNIFLAIEDTVSAEELRITGPLLYRMLLELRQAGDDRRIKNATDALAGALQTNWSRALAHTLQVAALTGRDMTAALEDLLIQLRDAERLAEERKRLNSESVRMVNWLIPLLYPMTLFLSCRYLGLSLQQVLHNQLTTPQGVTLLIAIAFLWAANGAALSLATGRKYDF